jgi:hypothetical protein
MSNTTTSTYNIKITNGGAGGAAHGGGDPSRLGAADAIDCSILLAKMQEWNEKILLPDGSTVQMPWSELVLPPEERMDREKLIVSIMREKEARIRAVERREAERIEAEREAMRIEAERKVERIEAEREAMRIEAEREAERIKAEREAFEFGQTFMTPDEIIASGVSLTLCPRMLNGQECPPPCRHLHYEDLSSFTCPHGDDLTDRPDWCKCHDGTLPRELDLDIWSLRWHSLPYLPLGQLIGGGANGAVHSSKLEHIMGCTKRDCNKFHWDNVMSDDFIPHPDGSFWVPRAYFATLGNTAGGLPATGRP